jgi:hypothetical protein
MATTSYPQLLAPHVGGGAGIWYFTGTDVHTDVDAADYFTNGHAAGMRVGDILIYVKSTATVGATLHSVSAVTAGGAATVSPAILA